MTRIEFCIDTEQPYALALTVLDDSDRVLDLIADGLHASRYYWERPDRAVLRCFKPLMRVYRDAGLTFGPRRRAQSVVVVDFVSQLVTPSGQRAKKFQDFTRERLG